MEKSTTISRVSSKEQADEGYSLDAQDKSLGAYSDDKGFELVKAFRISESASGKYVRKLFYEILKFVKDNGINIIIVEKIDRLTRNAKDALMMYDWLQEDERRQIHFVKESFIASKNTKAHENFIWDVKVAAARFFSSNLSEEVIKGRKEKLAQGWLPAQPKLGYKTEGEAGHKIHVVNDVEAPYVKKMFALYASGNYSLKRVMIELYDAGFRTKNGFKVSIGNLERLLADPFYYGVIRWEGKIHPGKHEPLVSKEIFDKVQEIRHGRNAPMLTRHYYLFKGYFHCANCGGTITWERHKGRCYGHCNFRYRKCDKKTYVLEDVVECELLVYFSRLQLTDKATAEWLLKALKESHGEEIRYFETTLEQLKIELARYQSRLDNIYEDKLDGKITQEYYDTKFKEFTAKKERIAEDIAKHSKQGSEYFEMANTIYELGQKGRLVYKAASPEQKQELLKLVFGKLELDGPKVIAEYSKPFASLATAVKMTNKMDISSEIQIDGKIYQIFSELKVSLINKGRTQSFDQVRPMWLRMLADIRT